MDSSTGKKVGHCSAHPWHRPAWDPAIHAYGQIFTTSRKGPSRKGQRALSTASAPSTAHALWRTGQCSRRSGLSREAGHVAATDQSAISVGPGIGFFTSFAAEAAPTKAAPFPRGFSQSTGQIFTTSRRGPPCKGCRWLSTSCARIAAHRLWKTCGCRTPTGRAQPCCAGDVGAAPDPLAEHGSALHQRCFGPAYCRRTACTTCNLRRRRITSARWLRSRTWMLKHNTAALKSRSR
ncbi:hypothetical protein D3C81_1568640 [compost metagenome]